MNKYDISLPQDKINALGEVEKMISAIYSEAERDVNISVVAKKFGVEASGIKSDVSRMIAKARAAAKRDEGKRVHESSVGYFDSVNPDFIKAPAVARCEEAVLGIMILYPEHRRRVFEERLLTEDDFFTGLNKRIFSYLMSAHSAGNDSLYDIAEFFTPEENGRISRMRINRLDISNGENVLTESISALKKAMEANALGQATSMDALNEMIRRRQQEQK